MFTFLDMLKKKSTLKISKYILIISYLSAIILNLEACQNENDNEQSKFEIVDSLSIDISPHYTGMYELIHVNEISGNLCLVGFSKATNSVEFLNLDSSKVINKVIFPSEGPNGVRKINGLYYHNKDSVFLLTDYQIFIINDQGIIKKKFWINTAKSDLKGDYYQRYLLSPNGNRPIHFYPKRQLLIVPTNFTEVDQWSPPFYEKSICSGIHLRDSVVEELPVFYPEIYRTQSFGLLNKSYFTYNQHLIFFGFQNAPDIYQYNLETGATSHHQVNSIFNLNQNMPPYTGATNDFEDFSQYISDYTLFSSLIFNPFEDRFYLFSGNIVGPENETAFNFTILNQDFNTIKEFSPDLRKTGLLPMYNFPVRKGMAFVNWAGSNEKVVKYNAVKF